MDLSGSTITIVPDLCFRGCQNLGLVELPTTCTKLGTGAFFNCTNLQISNTDLARLTEFGNSCFSNSGLTGELIFSHITTMSGNTNAFDNTTVTKVDFTGSTFTTMSGYFFSGHRSIQKIILPSTVTSIGSYCCAGAVSLLYINIAATVPPTLEGALGIYLDNPAFKIYVPDESVADYKAATYWSDHSARIFGLTQFAIDFPNG